MERVDYIVIGSGIAGLRATLELAGHGEIVVLTKERVTQSSTEYAQGGVAVVMSDDDHISLHYEDTLRAGAGLCDPDPVKVLVEEGPTYIEELIGWGARFDRVGDQLELGQEAAHSRRRILHARGDSTGREIVRTMLGRLRRVDGVQVRQHALSLQLLTDDRRCLGVRYVDTITGECHAMVARAVILATGGAGQVFAQTTNPDVATGDGIAMAYRAGALVADMEFVQFHPTALNLPGAPRFLLSEAMRGEGGRLRNGRGEAFMPRYHPRAEMAPRDVVARAIISEMERTGTATVFLDVRHLGASFLKRRFPRIYRTCLKYNLDIARDLIPVSPAAHYIMGGVRTDVFGRTSIPGLYAAGEVACSGIHGANRLASNSLLEGLVFGARAAQAAKEDGWERPSLGRFAHRGDERASWRVPDQIVQRVREAMWQKVGLIRSGRELQQALALLEELDSPASDDVTRNFLTVAQLIARAALFRRESRGSHYRTDYPHRDDERWLVHSGQQRGRSPFPIPVGDVFPEAGDDISQVMGRTDS